MRKSFTVFVVTLLTFLGVFANISVVSASPVAGATSYVKYFNLEKDGGVPTAGIITRMGELLTFAQASQTVATEEEDDMASSDVETVWAASNLRVDDTSWLNTVGTWQDRDETARYFSEEGRFDYISFLEDIGAEDIDIRVSQYEDGETSSINLIFKKDGLDYYLVTTLKGEDISFSFGATGIDDLLYFALSEERYLVCLNEYLDCSIENEILEAADRAARYHWVIDSDEGGIFTDEEIFNDFILVMLANPKMIYPEDTKGEYIEKICPFDGIMPHQHFGANDSNTNYSQQHTTIATVGSDL